MQRYNKITEMGSMTSWECIILMMMMVPLVGLSQNPYDFNLKNDGPIIGLAAVSFGTYISLNQREHEVTEADIAKLDPLQLWAPNRWSVSQNSLPARHLSDILLRSSIIAPLTLLAGERSRKNFGAASIIAVEALLLNTALTNVTKASVMRSRPYLYRDDYKSYDWKEKNAQWSFYSGHTSTLSVMTFVTAQMYSDYYPDSRAKTYVWTTAALLPALQGYLRMRGGRHFFTDVLVGYVAGAIVGIVVPRLH